MIKISARVPKHAMGANGIDVLIDGESVGRITQAGERDATFRLPSRRSAADGVARLSFRLSTWRPSEREPGNTDNRALGISVRSIDVYREGAEDAPAGASAIHREVDASQLALLTRSVGQGRTILLTDPEPDPTVLGLVFSTLLPKPVVDGAIDGRYATATDSGVLWFDSRAGRIWESPR